MEGIVFCPYSYRFLFALAFLTPTPSSDRVSENKIGHERLIKLTCILPKLSTCISNLKCVKYMPHHSVCLQMSFNGQIEKRRVAYVLHCAGGTFSNITRKMFSGFKFFCHGVKWSPDDIDAPVKTIVRRFQRREIALASLIYVKTRFFPSSAKRRYPKPFSNSSYLFPCRPPPRRRRQHVCAAELRQLSGKL